MPIAVTRDDERRRLTIAVTGTVTFEEVGRFIQTALPLPAAARGFDIVVELAAAQIVGGTAVHAHALAILAADQDPARNRGRIAIVAGNSATLGVARMYATYRASHGLTIRVFLEQADAEAWLAEPPLLMP